MVIILYHLKKRGSILYHLKKRGSILYHLKKSGSILYHFGRGQLSTSFKNGGLSGRAYPYSFTMGVPPRVVHSQSKINL